MKTFEIASGDLVIGRGGYALVSGTDKLRQDLSVMVREPYGVDRFHRLWGSLLDSMIGGVIDKYASSTVSSEVYRLLNNYAAIQKDQMTASSVNGRKPQFSNAEVIAEIRSVDVRQALDRLYVRATVLTLSGEQVDIFTKAVA